MKLVRYGMEVDLSFEHKKTGVLLQVDVKKGCDLVYYAYAGEWVDIHHLKQIKDDLFRFREYNG